MNEKQKLAALSDLEGGISDALMAVSILTELVENDTGRVFTETRESQSYATVIVGRAEAERLLWMAGDCVNRIEVLQKAYYAAIKS